MVDVSPPHGLPWQSPAPMTSTEVLRKLSELGCHSTDITDALYAADGDWRVSHDQEVLERRKES